MRVVKLTVGIPTYNRCDVICNALDSLLPQVAQLEQVDVLIVDNASLDDTTSVVRKYQEAFPGKINYRRNDANIGFAGNVDAVVHAAQGQYVLILSDDDALAPGAIDYVLDLLAKHDVAAVFLGVEAWDRGLTAPLCESRSSIPSSGRYYACGADFVAGEKSFPPGCISGYVVSREEWIQSRAIDFRDTLVVQVLAVLRMASNRPVYLSYVPHVRFRTENENGDASFYRVPLGLFRHRIEPLEWLQSACMGYPSRSVRMLRNNAMRTIIYHLVMDDCSRVDLKELERRLVKANGWLDLNTLIVSALIRLPKGLLHFCSVLVKRGREKGWL